MTRPAWLPVAALAVTASRLGLGARVPDDYDSLGFVRALDVFALSNFQPHFPGYPVYVALGRAVHLFVRDPLWAATSVSALAAGATAWAVFHIARALSGADVAAWWAFVFCACASLPWLMGSMALSDSTATAFATFAFACLAIGPRRSGAGAFLIGIMLGVRISYWPLALSFLSVLMRNDRAAMRRAITACALGVAVWALPFIVIIGWKELLHVAAVHMVGHFTVWGGSIVTRPSVFLRALALARDIVYDGLLPSSLALVGASFLVALGRPRPSRTELRFAALLFFPYAVWIYVGQNVLEQPRHTLPLVVMLTIALGVFARERFFIGMGITALMFGTSASLAFAHATTRPAAWQAARFIESMYPAQSVAVFWRISVRFFDEHPRWLVRERTSLSEVDVELERLDVLPHIVVVTDEIEGDDARDKRLTMGPTFCRDARLDRAHACLTLRTYSLGLTP